MVKKRKIKGWLHISEACERYGHDYPDLRRLVTEQKVFTRGRFTSMKPTAPIYLRVDELEAFKRGGVGAVRDLQAAAEKASTGTEN